MLNSWCIFVLKFNKILSFILGFFDGCSLIPVFLIREMCMVCIMGEPGECRIRGCVYQLVCKSCRRKYRGQTGRSVHERFGEEVKDWLDEDDGSPLWQHCEQYHEGQFMNMDVEIKVIKHCFGKPSRRMISEAVMIEQLKDNETMNNKREWTYTRLNKVNVA